MGKERRFLLITHPRSASNLLMRMLTSKQQNVKHADYNFYIDALEAARNFKTISFDTLTAEEQKETMQGYAAMVQRFKDHFVSADVEGKIATDKEHTFLMLRPELQYKDRQDTLKFLEDPEATVMSSPNGVHSRAVNPTVVDNDFLKSVTPIFLIRHPALAIPSYSRVPLDSQIVPDALLKHNRELYDWYVEQNTMAEPPMIIDAEDYMSNPELLRHLARKMGLDPEQIAFSWTSATDEEKLNWPQVKKVMTQTFAGSTGIIRDRVKTEIDLDAEEKNWREEFGEEKATIFKWAVMREMDDYAYLMARRFTVN